jgi:putative alpha-1,2-mannosidase
MMTAVESHQPTPGANLFGSIWDQFRSQLPLLSITDPTAVTDMVRSLIDTYRHLGWLPDCRMSLNKGYTQVKTAQTTAPRRRT